MQAFASSDIDAICITSHGEERRLQVTGGVIAVDGVVMNPPGTAKPVITKSFVSYRNYIGYGGGGVITHDIKIDRIKRTYEGSVVGEGFNDKVLDMNIKSKATCKNASPPYSGPL